MKPTLGRFFIFILLLGILIASTVSPTTAQAPEPETITDDGEIISDFVDFEQVIAERHLATVNGGGNSINAATSWWSSSGTTFVPASSTTAYNYGGLGCMDTGANGDIWRGQVNLPHGSRITGMWFNYHNEVNDPTDSIISLRRYSYTGAYNDILSVGGTTTGVGNHTTFTNTVANNVVDNWFFTYVLVWSGRSDQNLCGVNLGFEAPPVYLSALPLIKR